MPILSFLSRFFFFFFLCSSALSFEILLLSLGSLAAATPYLAAILGVVVVAWLRAARSLSGQFEEAMAKEQGASSASSTAPA